MKEEPVEESNCKQIVQHEYLNVKGEGIDVKSEMEKTINTAEQKQPPRSSPYGPWVPVQKVPEKPKVSVLSRLFMIISGLSMKCAYSKYNANS